MLHVNFADIVDFCLRRASAIILAGALVLVGSSVYVARHFAINSDISNLLSPDLPWRQRELAYEAAFPERATSIVAVVGAPTPEFAEAATAALVARLAPQTNRFRSVDAAQAGEFFARDGLLFLPQDVLAERMDKLSQAAPLIGTLAADQSLRGLANALSMGLQGVTAGVLTLDDMARPLDSIAAALENVLAERPATFSWRVLFNGTPARPEDLTGLVNIVPVLDYGALQPGKTATQAIRMAATDARLDADYDASVRLTGTIPLADAQLATLQQGVWLNTLITAAIVVIVLWLALRSARIVAAVLATIFVGLVATTALGLALVGAFNPISIAFAVLFVGLGADFAIQFSVRYRAQRHELHDLNTALVDAARYVGPPLTLAALAAAAGFLSFAPTDYRGMAELGLIAGVGMLVAYIASMTLLPALLSLVKPPPEPQPLGYGAMAGADRFMQRHRVMIVVATSLVAVAALPALFWLQFDFDPNSLQVPNTEAVETLAQLRADPRVELGGVDVLSPSADAGALAKRLSALPEVARARNLDSFIPSDQPQKIALIGKAASTIDPALHAPPQAKPSDADNVAALRNTENALRDAAAEATGPGGTAAERLAAAMEALAAANVRIRQHAERVFVRPLQIDLQQISLSLHPQAVARENLPDDLVRQWVAPNGEARTEASPEGDADDTATIRRFARAVLSVEPNATGWAIKIYQWGDAVTSAFVEAAALAIVSIAILLWLVLRRITDVLLTPIPLVVATVATLAICAVSGFALNYANIIALPALLGVGVAFKIYYVVAWRRGEYNFLQSSLTRAVFFSAVMTATAFGSLWFSAHPGISSMGKLLALSLACTLASAALFQPALMGPPRKQGKGVLPP